MQMHIYKHLDINKNKHEPIQTPGIHIHKVYVYAYVHMHIYLIISQINFLLK